MTGIALKSSQKAGRVFEFADKLADRSVAVVASLMGVAWFLGNVLWVADLVSHFWPFAGLLILPATGWSLSRRTRKALVGLLVTMIWAWLLAPYYLTSSQLDDGQPMRLVVCNLYSGNSERAVACQTLLSYDAEMIVLLEVSPDWMPDLEPLRAVYSHGRLIPREDNFGIGLLSKVPMQQITQKNFGSTGVPSLLAELEQLPVTIVATHPLPPMGMTYTDRRNRQLADVANFCSESSRLMIVAGDLNITPWSVHFGRLLREGRLRDSSLGFGIQPTWPTWAGMALLPIDHVLISEPIVVANRRVGKALGSDHHPVIVDLILPAK